MNKGFTLIELLVVVLIIGILTAIAVPQYQKAVGKSRFATMKNMVKSIYEAEQVYHLANGKYTRDLTALDISVNNPDPNSLCYIDGWGDDMTRYVACYKYINNVVLRYIMWFPNGKASCLVQTEDENHIGHWICKEETGKNPSCSNGQCNYN